MSSELELRAAAERLADDAPTWKGTYHGPEQEQGGIPNWIPILRRVLDDARKLARQYLAEHPADSDLPVTEEWLRSVGFRTDRVLPQQCVTIDSADSECDSDITYWIFPDNEEPLLHAEGNVRPATRGAVRLLCRALGIPLSPRTGAPE